MTAQVEVYVVDIIITGVKDSGKSTFLGSFTQPEQDADGWNTGVININEEVDARFVEPPEAYSTNYMWTHELIEEAEPHGFIVLCDSTRPEHFGETIGIVQTIRSHHPDIPCVLVANKQDSPSSWSAEDIRLGLNISNEVLVLGCDARNRKIVRNVVIELLTAIWNA